MRRRVTLVSVVVLVAAVAAGLVVWRWPGSDVGVTVEGKFGARPTVSFPDGPPPGDLAVETLVEGSGRGASEGDLVVADYVGYRWNKDGNKLLANTYIAGEPGAFPTGRLLDGLEEAFSGARPGSRVVAMIPPGEGYGDAGSPQRQVGAGDSLLYVLDVRAVYPKTSAAKGRSQPLDDPKLPKVGSAEPGKAPPVTVPKASPPEDLQVRALVQGKGDRVAKGQLVALHYVGVFWRDGKVFDSSWGKGYPNAVAIGTGQVMKGWDQAVVGQRVGSRLLLVVPPELGYGKKGLKQAGIKGDDTLVFVVDILGAH